MLATICNTFQLKPICIGHFTLGRVYNARTDGLLTACLFGEHTDVRATSADSQHGPSNTFGAESERSAQQTAWLNRSSVANRV